MKTKRQLLTALSLLLLVSLLLLAAGCDQQPPAGGNAPPVVQQPAPVEKPAAKERTYVLYRADAKAGKLIAEAIKRPDSEQPEKRALELLLSEAPADKRLYSVMPKDVRLLGLTIRNKVAYADFSKELKTNALGGAAYELLLVNGVVNTLTEFTSVERVQFLVNGRAIATINGHLDLTEPLARDESMIKRP